MLTIEPGEMDQYQPGEQVLMAPLPFHANEYQFSEIDLQICIFLPTLQITMILLRCSRCDNVRDEDGDEHDEDDDEV